MRRRMIGFTFTYVVFGLLWMGVTNGLMVISYGNVWPQLPVIMRFLIFLLITACLFFVVSGDVNPFIRRTKRQAKEAIKDSKQIFESVFTCTTDPLAVYGLDMNTVKINPAFEQFYGYSLEEMRGGINQIIPEHEQIDAARYFDDVKFGREPFQEFTGKRICKDGNILDVIIKLSPLKNGRDDIVGVSSCLKDITDWQRTQEWLLHSERLLAVGELAAGVAHEIRNPLTAVSGLVHLLPDSSPEKQTTYGGLIQSELKRIDSIVSELLSLSKPRDTNFHLIYMRTCLSDVVQLLEAEALLKNVELSFDIGPDIPPIEGDSNQLKQVFINVIKNAIDAMPQGGSLQISLSQEECAIHIRFEDTGCGIPPDEIDKIGRPFFTTKRSGTGLGLLTSGRILSNHQGAMNIASHEGKGTTVTIILPVAQQAPALL